MDSQGLFQELVSKGASLNKAMSGNMLPLHCVTNRCSDEFFEELVQTYDKDQVSQSGVTAFQSYTRHILMTSGPMLLTDEQLISRLIRLAPTNHMINKTQHIWRLFCQDLVNYGNQPWFASHFHNIRRLLVALVDARIVDSFEKQYKCSSMIALFEEFEGLELSSGSYRWEANFLYHARFILRPPPDIMSQPSAITFLMRAIQQNDHRLVHWLLGVHVPVHIRVSDISPIEKACHTGSFQIFVEVFQAAQLALGDKFGDADLEILCGLIKTAGDAPESEDLSMKKIKFALDQGLSADERSTVGSRLGDPAILLAARGNRYDIVELLIEKGADVFVQLSDGWDLARFSIADNRIDLLRHLHDKIRKTSIYDWKTCLPCRFYPPSSPDDGINIYNASMLHLAVAGNCVEVMNYLLDNNLVEDVNTCTTELYTPLHIASFLGYVETIATLVRHGASINGVNDEQKRPIEIALMHEHHEAVETLRTLGAEEPSTRPGSPMSFEMDDFDKAQSDSSDRSARDSTSAEESDGDSEESDEMEDECTEVVETEAIFMPQDVDDCIQYGNLEEFQSLLSEDCPIDCLMPTCGVCDVLTYAVYHGRSDIVVWLLSIGATPRQAACSVHGVFGTLHQAVKVTITEFCLIKLLDKALEIGYAWSDSPISPLHLACFYDDVEAFEVMLDHLNANAERYCASISPWKEQDIPADKAAMLKALTSATTPSDCHQLGEGWGNMPGGVTALHINVLAKHLPMAMALINAGADVNSLNAEFQTPLIVAVIISDDDCALVEYLLDHGALMDHKDIEGFSAIAHAARHDLIHVARLLVERGASLETRNVREETVMHISSVKSLRCFIYFHQQRCDAEAISLHGYTIFHTHDLRIRTYILNARLIPHIDSINGKNLISDSLLLFSTRMTRMLYRSFPKDGRNRLLNSFRDRSPYLSPLCLAISKEELHDTLPWLLDEVVDMEREISEEGTALMYACSLGRFEQIKILVRRGAHLDYVDSNGRYHSGILSARQYPDIIRWLLVGRFQDQPKLASYTVMTKGDDRSESHHRVWLSVLVLLLTMTIMVVRGLFSAYRSTEHYFEA
ncbi:ankyrin repeat-containing domain protein [Fusarium flagelliforme]|uniref:ankyrin repeat-containing domain protein n=1 Tax=Fusarium flagelliforme TaxID=2675880 RepID=UPI001E8DECAE|nr:ankyrin repeat-containing domain protein [Fusarium flagelliforme]KAH7179969.1 ankyrin repeat-containing domain protein [Fusarium flagelliforme]